MADVTERLDEVEARAEAATDGPWVNYSPNPKVIREQAIYSEWLEDIPEAKSSEIAALMTPPDAEFIAHARTDLPDLLAVVKRVLAWADHMEQSAEALYESSEGDDDLVNQAETLRCDARYVRKVVEEGLGR